MAGEYVRARLRKDKDRDIAERLNSLIATGHDEADLVRAGLRLLFTQMDAPAMSTPGTAQPRAVKPILKRKENVDVNCSAIDDLLGDY